MIRKYKIYIIMGITVLLLFMVLPVDTKGDWEIPWDITLEGEGNDPAFRSSTVMEIFLKNGTAPKDITVFVNQQKINPIWDYEQSTQISFQEEGIYKVHIVHKNGYEEIRQVMVELNNPTTAKITAGAYTPGAWSKKNVVLEAYGAKAVSDIQFYEYKIGQDEWKQMKNNKLEISKDFDDLVYIRAVSKAGREGVISQIPVRVWKQKPELAKIQCDQESIGGWYSKIPVFSYDLKEKEGPQVHLYAQLTDLKTKEILTGIDQIPRIRKDGRYQLDIYTKDESGNRSEQLYQTTCFVDTDNPEIFVRYQNPRSEILKYQKAQIIVKDENLKKGNMILRTSGKQVKPWKLEGDHYETEVIFLKDGKQTLSVQAEDLAGNKMIIQEKSFIIDTQKPRIKIQGIDNGRSYSKLVKIQVDVKDQNLNPDKTYIYLNGKKMNSVMIKKDGYYTIDVKTEDLAGNQNRCSRKFTVNQKGIQIHFLQEDLKEKQISTKNLKPGFRIESLEPVQVMAFLVNGQKKEYQWKEDKVYIKDPITENGKCSVSLHVKDSAGNEKTSEEIQFFYDTQKPVIKIEGLDQKSECEYGKQIGILLENKTDQWEKVILDGKEQKLEHHKITWKELAPGKHVLHLKAVDQAGNKTDQRITFKITKVLPKAVKQIVVKQDKIPSKKDEKKQKHPNLWLLFLIGTSIFVSVKMFCSYRKSRHS